MKCYGIFWKVILFGMFVLGNQLIVLANSSAADFDLLSYPSERILTQLDRNKIFAQDSLALSKEKVRNWIKIRMQVAELQMEMKENAGSYENVVEDFYGERRNLLISLGWSVSEFDEVKERIHATISAMNIADELADGQEKHEKEVAEIRENTFYTDSQKEEIIEGLKTMREFQREQYIEPTKVDWPAVRPYKEIFEEVTSWMAGNRSHPPELSF